eukprot:CAMPEP_0182508912 /NCGR_PEP_ID=MMETSP1321-20130603/25854_1 /TAXON_ID=91990 /ORGANISM="Bolidomonas sp., Strain RCC1657" /LENGTH=77 /DNA_ID=CAMNT_0024715063 /DNA_START=96 /DNA_END=326 /DNA_ORIENTATION=+
MPVSVNLRVNANERFSVTIDSIDILVSGLKTVLETEKQIAVAEQRLIYKGRVLKDDQTLSSYGFGDGDTIHLVRGTA